MITISDQGLARPEPVVVRTSRLGPVPAPPPDELAVAPSVRAALGPMITALRWSALLIGMALSTTTLADGSFRPVWATAICVYLTSWRTMRPLPLGATALAPRVQALTDSIILGVAAGAADGMSSPFVFCLLAAAAVAALGWGVPLGPVALVLGAAAAVTTAAITDGPTGLDQRAGQLAAVALVLTVGILTVVRARLVEAERQRLELSGQIDSLTEANDLLQVLNRVARTLPSSLDLEGALGATARQLEDAFAPRALAILAPTDRRDEWSVLLQTGLTWPETLTAADLPPIVHEALDADATVLVPSLGDTASAGEGGSGLAAALDSKGGQLGVVMLEHDEPGRYTRHDAVLLEGLAEAVALSIDNARQFSRLRLLSASEERSRIARDLHDRLGQWLTFITLELERIQMGAPEPTNKELVELHATVQQAIDEFRQTLRALRTTVDEQRPLRAVADEVVEAFRARSDVAVELRSSGDQRLPAIVENELLRILQEALTNIEKHAKASLVVIDWEVDDRAGHLRIRDDGDGFDTTTRKGGSYGLQGMQERAASVGGRLTVDSTPGCGAVIDVIVPREATP